MFAGSYQPGDPPPPGYANWQAWAAVQQKAGLRQKRCARCARWKFPQELSALVESAKLPTRAGKTRRQRAPVCVACAAKKEG